MLLDLVEESHHRGGLSASNSSSVTVGISSIQGAEGLPSFSGVALALGTDVEGSL